MNPLSPVIFLWLYEGNIVVRKKTVRWRAWLYVFVVAFTGMTLWTLDKDDFRILPAPTND